MIKVRGVIQCNSLINLLQEISDQDRKSLQLVLIRKDSTACTSTSFRRLHWLENDINRSKKEINSDKEINKISARPHKPDKRGR